MTGSPDPTFEFETRRLRVRLLSETDQALFCGLYSDAEIKSYIGEPFTDDNALRSFRKVTAPVRSRTGR